jgi:amino acid transporter
VLALVHAELVTAYPVAGGSAGFPHDALGSLAGFTAASSPIADMILSRAHSRLSWAERLACNARPPTAGQVTIKLFGIPAGFATSLGQASA